MALLLTVVVAVDAAAALVTAKPQLWCAVIPALIPILTPAATFTSRSLEPKLSNSRALSHYSGILCPQVVVSLGFFPHFSPSR
jgi:hypothetical protein